MVPACHPGTQDVEQDSGFQALALGQVLASRASVLDQEPLPALAAAPTLRCQSWDWDSSSPGKLIQMFLSCGIHFLAGFRGRL